MKKLIPALITLSLISASALAKEPPTVPGKADKLLQSTTSWNGTKYGPYPKGQTQITMIKLTIPANSALPWHKHLFPNAGYVLQGQLTLEDRATGQSHTYKAGEAFPESVNRYHRGVSGDSETVLLLTYSGVVGQPTSVPAPGEKAEY